MLLHCEAKRVSPLYFTVHHPDGKHTSQQHVLSFLVRDITIHFHIVGRTIIEW